MKEKVCKEPRIWNQYYSFIIQILVMYLISKLNSAVAIVKSYEDVKYNINSFSKKKK